MPSPSPHAPRVYVHTFGCQMNVLDSEKMLALLEQAGYVRTDTIEDAQVLLINTCSIREKAETKLYSMLGRLRERSITLGVTGCVAQQEGAAILRRFPNVDLVMGPDAIPKIVELIERSSSSTKGIVETDMEDGLHYPFILDRASTLDGAVCAFVTIQKGCDNKCTFCIVPMTRGVERSRPADDILREIHLLAARGVKEITLLGQNVNSYGLKEGKEPRFSELLRRIHDEVQEIRRIRFTTSHPRDLDDDLIDAFASLPRLAPYFHLPVQSGSDRILKRMKRFYRRDIYLEKVAKLRRARPDIAISTDFIVGFPGESEADFEATLELLKDVRFDASYSFTYSPRPGTPALRLPDDVPAEKKKERLARLQTLQQTITREKNRGLIGTRQRILVEGRSKLRADELTGRTPDNRTVNFKGHPRLIGMEIEVEIVDAGTNSLRGRVPTLASNEAEPPVASWAV